VATNYAYDNLSRLQSVLHQLAGSTIDGATYTVDNAGNRTAKTDQLAAVTSNYGYDPIYELMGVTQGTNTTESYTYDPVGNRLSSLGVSPYSVNVSNELTSIPNTVYSYDNNGNTLTSVTGSNTTTYAWDFENRLTSVTLPGTGGTVSFKYDPFGRRIYKSSSSATSVYAYDGSDIVEETNSSGSVVARYAQGENIDEPLAMLRAGTTSYYHADGLGSITSLSSGSGSIAQTYTFDSFGKQTASSGSLTSPFRYAGRELDGETGLYFYRARYYDSSVGRFLSEDPIGVGVGMNRYRYVSNAPTRFVDPYGLFSLEISETWNRSSEPWWDPTEWGRGTTRVYTQLDVKCVRVGNCGWQRRIKLSVHFDVVYDWLSRHHEKVHIEIAEDFLKNSAPYFGYLERVTYPTKEACEAAKGEVEQVLKLVFDAMSNPQQHHDWKDRLRDLL